MNVNYKHVYNYKRELHEPKLHEHELHERELSDF